LEACIAALSSFRSFRTWSTLAGRGGIGDRPRGGSLVSKDALHERALRSGAAQRMCKLSKLASLGKKMKAPYVHCTSHDTPVSKLPAEPILP